jgi:threonine/homoserine/homoserine lactone efflux protein
VQILILSQAATRGLGGGLRVMLGANLTLAAILLALALGLSAVTPSETVLRLLRTSGGTVLVWIAVNEVRSIWRPMAPAPDADAPRRPGLGPTRTGIVMVLLNPGAWIFFATTASSVLAQASNDAGRAAAVATALVMALGVSVADLSFTLLGSGGRRLFGERGLRWVRTGLAALLGLLGALFVVQGVWG